MSAPKSPANAYHGLKSALTLVGLLGQLVAQKKIKLADPEILLDDGRLIKFTDEEYIRFAKTALADTIGTILEVVSGKTPSVEAVAFVKKLSEKETHYQSIVESSKKDESGNKGTLGKRQ